LTIELDLEDAAINQHAISRWKCRLVWNSFADTRWTSCCTRTTKTHKCCSFIWYIRPETPH